MTGSDGSAATMTFWDHLDELRAVALKVIAVVVVFAIAAFCFKDELFSIVLAPKESDFVTYRILRQLSLMASGADIPGFSVDLINTGLAEQFIIHMKAAFYAGLLCASPYIIFQIFRFVTPALYADERRYARQIAVSGYLMFVAGVLLSYFLIFPLTFRFLGTYQVAPDVSNLITLQSYMSTLIVLTLSMGIVFELPVVIWLLGKTGLITPSLLRRYRRHAIVVILIAAAIITPTTDVFTLMLVALPVWALYESSILLI